MPRQVKPAKQITRHLKPITRACTHVGQRRKVVIERTYRGLGGGLIKGLTDQRRLRLPGAHRGGCHAAEPDPGADHAIDGFV